MTKKLLQVFAGDLDKPPPIWLMRQAGRYLPEYRDVRQQAGSFLNLCYTPRLAAEVTLQPIRCYGLDAAILFSDILVVPDALGQDVRFVEGEGPRLRPIRDAASLQGLDVAKAGEKFDIVAETVARLRQDLPSKTTLIGFCGAPWTVATYMAEGAGSKDQAGARLWAYQDPDGFGSLVDILVEASIDYLSRQVEAGAEVLQIFDSWAGSLAPEAFDQWVIAPTKRIVAALHQRYPDVPVIGFPRGASAHAKRFVTETEVNGFSCDTATPLSYLDRLVDDKRIVLQGNLDPLLVVVGGDHMDRAVDRILEEMAGRPFVFNLGHGIVPQTPPEHVARLVERVRGKG